MPRLYTDTKIVGDRSSVADYAAYAYYRDNSRSRSKEVTPNFVEYGKIITSIYKQISDDVTEYEGGVYSKNFFYIIPIPYPNKSVQQVKGSKGNTPSLNMHTKGRIYTMLFVNLFVNKKYWMWGMDYSFTRKIKTKLSENLKNYESNFKFVLDSIIKTK